MLRLKNVKKTYVTGELRHDALRDVSVCFRKSEFVSILGQSGSGKTTLLNIIGGLDQYTSGDLIINGKSTKEYTDSDWDTYRNHSIGFVFQSYNLIPHQSVLANVELALTLSGVSKAERRRKALEALDRVGLSDQVHKRPNQISGGQMQRVAIARALVNDPDILLADEPTGALDSETSVQVLSILKEISKDRLVIMVTHNPELANRYSTRIIRLFDGNITDDSDPYEGEDIPVVSKKEQKKQKTEKSKRSMSLSTALSLSLNNLMIKKARTFLTSFAGSIGIIGIALILSVSTGFQAYIDRVQEDTLSSYPITIEAESVDLTSLITSLGSAVGNNQESRHELDAVYESQIMYDLMNSMNSAEVTRNNLTKFKEYLESNDEIKEYISAVQYSYDIGFNVYSKDMDDQIFKSDVMQLFENKGGFSMPASPGFSSFSSYDVWQEMLPGTEGELISQTLKEQYEVIAGKWPEEFNEIVLIVNENNEISDLVLYALGLKTYDEMLDVMKKSQLGEIIDTTEARSWSYDEILGMPFKLILNSEYYQKDADGRYTDLSKTDAGIEYLYNNAEVGTPMKISGIIRASGDAVASMMTGSIGYTAALTEYAMEKTAASEIIQKQLDNPSIDAITGLPFALAEEDELSTSEKAEKMKAHISKMSTEEKALLYKEIASTPSEAELDAAVSQQLAMIDRETLESMIIQTYAERMGVTDTTQISEYIKSMDDETLYATAAEGIRESIKAAYKERVEAQLAALDGATLAAMLDGTEFSEEDYAAFYDAYMPSEYSESTYEENLLLLGYASADRPSAINLYATSFKNKDEIARMIEQYNSGASEADTIKYTDYVGLLMSSVTTIINAVSYVLIAFVAISLVVSSIMIGIITYISVLERTKEIGILRAIGASKKDVSRVFNAETMVVGFGAGVIGIGFSLLLLIPINLILHKITGIAILSAQLPAAGAVILVLISILLTFIAGLIPSGIASRKNPVEALRTE
ncbi:MAG: ABC transporter ATP-binding protein/permease [Clostridiales bacterium]|nr:ABC transporter ATP-binding protein/permease [Clostridiales bacterium]